MDLYDEVSSVTGHELLQAGQLGYSIAHTMDLYDEVSSVTSG